MRAKSFIPIMMAIAIAALLVTPALAKPGKGPKYAKYVASLLDEEENRFGQVIFNTNPEDDGKFELEVEIEECMDLADSTVNVYLDSQFIDTIYVDEFGNGKATFYVEEKISTDEPITTITVVGDITLTSGGWRLWVKGPGPK